MEQKAVDLNEATPPINISNLLEDLIKLEGLLAQERTILKKVETTKIRHMTEQKKELFSEMQSHKATLEQLQFALKNNEDIQGMSKEKILSIKEKIESIHAYYKQNSLMIRSTLLMQKQLLEVMQGKDLEIKIYNKNAELVSPSYAI